MYLVVNARRPARQVLWLIKQFRRRFVLENSLRRWIVFALIAEPAANISDQYSKVLFRLIKNFGKIRVSCLMELSPERAANLLRCWSRQVTTAVTIAVTDAPQLPLSKLSSLLDSNTPDRLSNAHTRKSIAGTLCPAAIHHGSDGERH